MKASDVMTPNVVSVAPGTSVPEIAALLLERRFAGLAGSCRFDHGPNDIEDEYRIA